MYALNAMTLLMVVSSCDFNKLADSEEMDLDEQEEQIRRHKIFVRCRKALLYYLIPITMLAAVYSELKYEPGYCKASKIITIFTSSLCYIIFIFALIKILVEKKNDPNTPLKIKVMWVYLIFAMVARQAEFLVQIISDLWYPSYD